MEKVERITEKFHLSEVITIVATVIACFGYMMSEMHRIEAKMDQQSVQQSARTDRLYEMFVDLRKESEQNRKEMDQKFYDILKEGKK